MNYQNHQNQHLILHPTPLAQWHALINDAQLWRHLELGESLESYLVFLLMRYTDQPEFINSIIGIDFLKSLQAHQASQYWQLRDVGDKCLIFAGLFPEYCQHLRVENQYFSSIGRQAYLAIFNRDGNDLYLNLAHHFAHLREILLAIRLLATEPPQQLPLDESWHLLMNSFKSKH